MIVWRQWERSPLGPGEIANLKPNPIPKMKNSLLYQWALALALLLFVGPLMAQDPAAQTAITTEISGLITAGSAVGVAALGLFAARLIFPVVKSFFRAGK